MKEGWGCNFIKGSLSSRNETEQAEWDFEQVDLVFSVHWVLEVRSSIALNKTS